MPEQRILLILRGICSGLQAIHGKGYAHRWGPWPGVGGSGVGRLVMSPSHCRDLKPTNVLLDEDDQPILMDLGSMNRARMEVTNSREAMAVQVGARPGGRTSSRCPQPCIPSASVQDWAAQRCTISYRAPELFTVPSQCIIDERTDIWVRTQPQPPPPPYCGVRSHSDGPTAVPRLRAVLHDVRGGPLRRHLPEG